MSSESPVVEIFSSDGIELPVQNGVATPANTRGILVAGSDGTNSRFISTNTSGAIATTAPTLTKGTQAVNGWSVQNLKDAGRVSFSATCSATTGVTTEALISLTPVRTVTAGSAGTSLAVTSGKTLRLQSLILCVRNTSTVVSGVIIRVRVLAGTVLVGSQEIISIAASTLTATSGVTASAILDFPDGFEISGTTQIGISQLCSATTCTIDVNLLGFEY